MGHAGEIYLYTKAVKNITVFLYISKYDIRHAYLNIVLNEN
jgi:hypothetical protein